MKYYAVHNTASNFFIEGVFQSCIYYSEKSKRHDRIKVVVLQNDTEEGQWEENHIF